MKVFEEHHNTPEQVESYLQGALALTRELEVTGDLEAIVFTKAVDLLSAKTVQLAPDGVQVARPNGLGMLHG